MAKLRRSGAGTTCSSSCSAGEDEPAPDDQVVVDRLCRGLEIRDVRPAGLAVSRPIGAKDGPHGSNRRRKSIEPARPELKIRLVRILDAEPIEFLPDDERRKGGSRRPSAPRRTEPAPSVPRRDPGRCQLAEGVRWRYRGCSYAGCHRRARREPSSG